MNSQARSEGKKKIKKVNGKVEEEISDEKEFSSVVELNGKKYEL